MIHKSKFIKSLSEVKELIAHCKETGYASIDYETNAREPKDPEFRPTIISVSFQPGSAWVIPLAHKDSIFKRKWKQVFKLFASGVLQDRTIIKIAWNAKFEQKVSMALGYRIMGRLFDPMLLKYLLDEMPPNDLKSQVDFLLPEFGGYDLENQPGKKASREAKINFWENVPLKELSKYGALDADLAFRLFLHYDKRVMELGLYHYSRNFYGPLTHILAETELLGVQVDRVYLEGQVKSFADKLDKLEASIRSIPFIRDYEEDLKDRRIAKYIEELEEEIDYGDLTQAQINNRLNKISKLELGVPTTNKEQKLFDPINFNSTTQLAELLYGDDGFGFECTEFTETGNPSCGESALKALRGEDDSGFINSLLEHRELTKMYTTYLKGIYENHLTDWGTIHPGYLVHGTTCVSDDTILIGPRGDTRIGDIAPSYKGELDVSGLGLKVLTHNERYSPVALAINKGLHPMVEIKDDFGNTLQCTLDHRMYSELGWKSVKEILDKDLKIVMVDIPSISPPPSPPKPTRISNIHKVKDLGLKVVYDLHVPGDESYVTQGGFINHNTGRFSSRNPSFQTMPRSTTAAEIKRQFTMDDGFFFVEFDGCIPGYVKISTKRGLVPMEEVGPQDQVLLGDKFYQVLNQWSTGIKDVFEITTNTGRKIQATSNHPFLTPKGWVELGKLRPGDILTLDTSLSNPMRLNPNYLESYVAGVIGKGYEVIESIEYLGKDKVYDLEVQGSHAFVANGVIVHNSQMELRMAAELSGDDNMLSIFHNNQNIHAMTAALLTGKPYELINSLRKDENHPDHLWAIKEHKKAKVLNFTILYGAGPPTVSEFVTDATGTFHSKADAQEMIDQWFEAYPKVAQWIKKQHKFSINHGYLVNPFGRRRRFPILLNPRNKNSQQGLWNEALRQGPNAVIQGGSSDITQWVNISIQRERLMGNLPGYMRLISTVHDSLEYPVHKDDMAWVLPKVIELASSLKDMKKYMGWTMTKVQMKFSCEFGINWGTMHEFDPGKKHKDLDFSQFYEEELERYGQEPYPHKWKLLK